MIFLLLLLHVVLIDASKILGIFIHPGISHFNVFKPVLLELSNRGHELEVISYFPNNILVPNYKDLPLQGQDILTGSTDLRKFERKNVTDYFTTFFELKKRGEEYCKSALNSPVINQIFASHARTPFTLVIAEFYNTDCMLGVAHLLNVPVVGVTSCTLSPWHYDRVSAEEPVRGRGLGERLIYWWTHRIVRWLYRSVQWTDNQLLAKRFGIGKIPDVGDLARNTSLVLVNQHYSLTGAVNLSPRLIEIGGVHLRAQVQSLPEDIEKILSSNTNVVYISWGSKMRINTLPTAKRDAIIDACLRLNLTVLWKWDDEVGMLSLPNGVHLRKWLPQQEVLCHDNVKVFLSHGGMLGVLEAVHCGVPIIVTPLYRDQFINAQAVEERDIGLVLPYEDLNPEVTLQVLKKALTPKVVKNMQQVSESFNSRQVKPLDVAIWNIESVIATGAVLIKTDETIISLPVDICIVNLILLVIGIVLTCIVTRYFWRIRKVTKQKKND